MMHQSLLHAIGNTPLVKLPISNHGSIYAKLEYLNPGGSVKDRSALFMIEEAERSGKLKPGGTIIDASSGNQGIASAMIGAIKGYKVIVTVSEKISEEKLKAILAYGAQVIMCPSTKYIEDPNNYHRRAVELNKNTPNSFMPNQYFNPLNAQGHYTLLAPEVWKQTNGTVTHFFAAAGTCGTISGVGRYLKEKNPAIKILAVDSDKSFRSTNGNPQPYKVEGMGIDWNNSPVLDESVIDDYLPVSDDNALGMLKTLASKHGILAGPSSGAVAWAAQDYARHLKDGDVAVIIFGDSGRAYLTKNFY
ncbi:MAG: PLP-dependent cysteine synthase family protein [Candidatus Babeliales bacterium]